MVTRWSVAALVLVLAVLWRFKSSLPRLLITEYKWMETTRVRHTDSMLNPEYDYVIVGGGAAGAILAVRLSEDPKVTVALMETGPNNKAFPALDTPMYEMGQQKTDADWRYQTVPQHHACHSLEEQRAVLSRGKILGGTSSLSSIMAVRGSRHDFDRWAAMGNKGWSYKDVLPYFKKFETVHGKKSGYRGSDGPIQLTEKDAYPEAANAFLKAAQAQGFKVGDVNAEEMIDRVMKVQANVGPDGVRQSVAEAYLKPLAARPNLHVKTNSHAIMVLFDGKRAAEVHYMNEQMKKIRARKEIILTAGTIGSAQILMLSGVGPKEHLKKLGIPLVADLPVGQTLQDHVHVHAATVTLDKPLSFVPERLGLKDELEYKIFGTGPYSQASPIATAFSRSKQQPADFPSPNLQYVLLNNMMNTDGHGEDLNMKPNVHEALYGGLEGRDGLNLVVSLQQPASVGDLRLDTSMSFDPPLINPNYLAEQVDVDKLLDGIRTARKIMSSGPLVKELGAKLVKRVHPNCANETYDSDGYWRCYIRSNSLSSSHPTSTCRMGPVTDPNSVVDATLRVHGLQGLRVVDASVIPFIPSGNTDFSVMMIAERAADIIKGKN